MSKLEAYCGFKPGALASNAGHDLVRDKLIRIDRKGRVNSVSAWAKALRVSAYEVKLLKWRRALNQAAAYRSFADEAFVVLPEEFAKQAILAKEEFLAAGVGLIVVGSEGIAQIIGPRRSNDHDWRREYVCSRLMKASVQI